jgi:transcription elongation factor Elf1
MGEKIYNQKRESKKRRRRVQKVNCPSCREKLVVEDEIDNGNFDEIAGVKYIICPICGQEIIIN